jgi:hypothetical protein
MKANVRAKRSVFAAEWSIDFSPDFDEKHGLEAQASDCDRLRS